MKRRPFALCGLTACAAALLGWMLCAWMPGGVCCLCLGLLLLAAAVVLLLLSRSERPVRPVPSGRLWSAAAATAGLILCILFLRQQITVLPAERLDGESAVVGGFVSSVPEKSGRLYQFTLETDTVTVTGAPQRLKLNVYSLYPPEAGENVYLNVKLSVPEQSYGFDSAAYYRAQGIYLNAFCYTSVTPAEKTGHPIRRFFLTTRKKLGERLSLWLAGDEAAVARALLLGDKSQISDDLYRSYRNAGLAHILAISGLHTSILVMALYGLLRRLRVKIRPACLITALILIGYMLLTGFPPSVTRAGLMALMMLAARALAVKTDFANTLGLAALLMLLWSPASIMDVSFQLSFSATLGICLCAPAFHGLALKVRERCKTAFGAAVLPPLIESAGAGLAASAFVLPLSMLQFETVSLLSFITSLIVTPLLILTLPLLTIYLLIGLIPSAGFLIRLPAATAAGLIRAMTAVAEFFGDLPFGRLPSGSRLIGTAVLIAVLLGVSLLLYRPIRRFRAAFLCTAALILCAALFTTVLVGRTTASVIVLPDEAGSCVLIRSDGKTYAFGGGSAYQIRSASRILRSLGAEELDGLLFADESQCSEWESSGITVQNAYADQAGSRISEITVPLGDFAVLRAVYNRDASCLTVEAGGSVMLFSVGNTLSRDADVCLLLSEKARYSGVCRELYCVSAENARDREGFLITDSQPVYFRVTENGFARTNGIF